MISSLTIAAIILLEVLGFGGAQDKVLSLSKNATGTSLSAQIAGEKINADLPEINIDKISPEPTKKDLPEPRLSAGEAYVLDLGSHKELFSKNPDDVRPIASVTKIMTSLVTLEDLNTNEIVTVTSKAANQIGSKMHLLSGEQISARELVYGMLVKSANDAAIAIQEHFGQDKVVGLMNAKAQKLGLEKTHYVEASGLDQGNVSTVRDLALLSNYALNNKEFAQAVSLVQYDANSVDGHVYHLSTTNRLLKNYPDIFGVKTGYTEEAGNCLISAASENGQKIVAVVLNVPNYDVRFAESRSLLDWTFANYQW
jgi:D-alanyl-D-alanine carboxypeptidase